jgi:hypothetical protein
MRRQRTFVNVESGFVFKRVALVCGAARTGRRLRTSARAPHSAIHDVTGVCSASVVPSGPLDVSQPCWFEKRMVYTTRYIQYITIHMSNGQPVKTDKKAFSRFSASRSVQHKHWFYSGGRRRRSGMPSLPLMSASLAISDARSSAGQFDCASGPVVVPIPGRIGPWLPGPEPLINGTGGGLWGCPEGTGCGRVRPDFEASGNGNSDAGGSAGLLPAPGEEIVEPCRVRDGSGGDA